MKRKPKKARFNFSQLIGRGGPVSWQGVLVTVLFLLGIVASYIVYYSLNLPSKFFIILLIMLIALFSIIVSKTSV